MSLLQVLHFLCNYDQDVIIWLWNVCIIGPEISYNVLRFIPRSKNWVKRHFRALKSLTFSTSGYVWILPQNHHFSELIESLKLNQVNFHCHIVKLLNWAHRIILFDGHIEDGFVVSLRKPTGAASVGRSHSAPPHSSSLLNEQFKANIPLDIQ